MTTTELMAAIIALAVSWFSITKVFTKQGWARTIWSIVGLLFFISWLGNSLFYFGMVGWIASVLLTILLIVLLSTSSRTKARHE